ncbi:MAG: YgiQ family radical SAM protein, partial [Campylobacteraceae bacterium]
MSKFLPTTKEEMNVLGWKECDVILVTADSYIDSPFIGTAVVARLLELWGYRVGIIAQPDFKSGIDITRLGEPKLFWGVNGGSVDSMVANYTATKKFRKSDDYTPGGQNTKRPDRAVIVYCNLIRQHFKNSVPIVLGGIEASLRRVSHYDFWSNSLRKPILFDAKADYLIYGMGENALKELSLCLKEEKSPLHVKGISYISKEKVEEYTQLPSHEEVLKDKEKYIDLFDEFYKNNDPLNANGLCEKVDSRYLVQNPPNFYTSTTELDTYSKLPYTLEQHPYYEKMGKVKCLETIKFSLLTHQGCWGECNFCAITTHQGRTIRSRSKNSVLDEVKKFTTFKDFKGVIHDLGGPSANMYDYECKKKITKGACKDKRCASFEGICKAMKVSHKPIISLLNEAREIKGVKHAFVASGIRYDLINEDKENGVNYLKTLTKHHISGQMKIAPEHTEDKVLKLMGKPNKKSLVDFKNLFYKINEQSGKKQFLTYYLIAAHPGCAESDMKSLKDFTNKELKLNPEQVQIFTPTPGTYSSVMYYTKLDPTTRKPIFVETEIR